MVKWNPSETQQSGSINTTFEFLNKVLTELQEELDCPDEFICDFLDVVKNQWSSDSCHSKARRHKRDNPSFYE